MKPHIDVEVLLQGISNEERRSETLLPLCAFENRVSIAVQRILGSSLSLRYRLGNTGDPTYYSDIVNYAGLVLVGYPSVGELERIALQATKSMLGDGITDVRPLSGVHAMTCTILCCTEPGDIVLSISPENGGHFATKHIVERAGRKSMFLPTKGLRHDVDLSELQVFCSQTRPSMVFLDCGTPLFLIDISGIREVVGKECLISYDASHTMGIICGQQMENPLSLGADILQGNTHKSLPGPQKGMFHVRNSVAAEKIQLGLSKGLVSSSHLHHVIALLVTLIEAERFGEDYAKLALKDAQVMGEALLSEGIDLVRDERGVFTESHVFLIRFGSDAEAYSASRALLDAGIAVNARRALGEPVVRIGTQEIARLGIAEEACRHCGEIISGVLNKSLDINKAKSSVSEIMKHHCNPMFGFN